MVNRIMKYLIFIILIVTSIGSIAEPKEILSTELISNVKENHPEVDTNLFTLATKGDIDSAIKTSEILFRLNSEKMVNKGVELLSYYANDYKIARLHLGMRYLEGVEIISADGKTKRLLINYDKAIKFLSRYLAEPIPNNDNLFLIAFSMLGSAYSKNENYENAANHFLNNIELVKAEQSGLSAFELANLYRDGNGVEENKEEAFYWYDLSSKKGLNIAIMERNFLAIELEKE